MKNIYLIVLFLCSFLLVEVNAQAVGDYGSGLSGNWGTAGTWLVCKTAGQWTDATVATGTPSASVNVYIRNGHTVTLDASGKNCKNLFIENGAIFKGNATQPTSSNVYVRLSGDLTNNGTFGAALNDNICIECSTNVVLKGTGVYNICRIRPASNISNITITFDADATITYLGSTGSGGSGLMTLNSGNDNITFVINAGKTITMVDYCNFATSSSTATSASLNSTFTINGTVIQQGTNGHLNLKTATGKVCNFTIGSTGSFTVAKNIVVAQAGDTTSNIVVNGTLTAGQGYCDLSNPKQIITGTGTFTLPAGGTLYIGGPDGMNPGSGQIRTTVRNLNAGAFYNFLGTAAQVTGVEFPATVSRLTVNNAAGVTLSKALKVADTLYLTAGLLKLAGNNLIIGAAGAVNVTNPDATRMIALDAATSQVRKEFAANGSFFFPVGLAGASAEYTPVSLALTASSYSAAAPAYVGLTMTGAKHPNNTSKADYLNHYWTLVASGVTSPVYNADFYYAAGDVTGNKANINGLRYSAGKWYSLGKIDTVNSKFSAANVTEFGDFTGGELEVIPVELAAFTASANGRYVTLKWSTATETNNKGFEIQRKVKDTFETISFINGAGTSSALHNYSYTDNSGAVNSKVLVYRLKQIDLDGSVSYSPEASVELTAPSSFNLLQNYPNPFNPSTIISYQLPVDEHITLSVFNSLGQEVAQLVNETKSAGTYDVTFDASKLSSGIYYAVLKIGRQNELVKTIKMSLIK